MNTRRISTVLAVSAAAAATVVGGMAMAPSASAADCPADGRVMANHFDTFDAPKAFELLDGQTTWENLRTLVSHGDTQHEVPRAAQNILNDPAFWNRLDTSGGMYLPDGIVIRQDVRNVCGF
ncbi:hypothetical protein [Pseudosporangium ferrugineum]|uniref:Uncharacterized protein n=1 Tax=Pseudosporangium ferrugineum TaxID=439699 RepID=A0A2T0RQ64_9ACTN|nr:hypothetical protein [Pseudosporangium ferrugineum]PRY23335.1 hypothetical protein CLV70_11562 [Pseudosporangium ferrugineum]